VQLSQAQGRAARASSSATRQGSRAFIREW